MGHLMGSVQHTRTSPTSRTPRARTQRYDFEGVRPPSGPAHTPRADPLPHGTLSPLPPDPSTSPSAASVDDSLGDSCLGAARVRWKCERRLGGDLSGLRLWTHQTQVRERVPPPQLVLRGGAEVKPVALVLQAVRAHARRRRQPLWRRDGPGVDGRRVRETAVPLVEEIAQLAEHHGKRGRAEPLSQSAERLFTAARVKKRRSQPSRPRSRPIARAHRAACERASDASPAGRV